MARLALFAKGNSEYVVIITEGEPEEYRRPGYKIEAIVDIGDDKLFSVFPCGDVLENTEM